MIVCAYCKKEMRCEKMGIGCDFGNGHVYAGDSYKCPTCHVVIIKTNEVASFDPEHEFQDEYITMDKGE